MDVTTISVFPQSPLFVANGASTWNARHVPVGRTFESCVRTSVIPFVGVELVVEVIVVIFQVRWRQNLQNKLLLNFAFVIPA